MSLEINVKNTIKECRTRFNNKTLGMFRHESCRYQYEDGNRCAIGSGMDDELIQFVLDNDINAQSLAGVLDHEEVSCDQVDDLSTLQTIHDNTCHRYCHCLKDQSQSWKDSVEKFDKFLTELEKKYA